MVLHALLALGRTQATAERPLMPLSVIAHADQRTQLDLSVRLAVISLIAVLASVLFLWRAGLWVLLALVPYALVYLFYRGAIVVAGEYGVALTTLIDLNRFALYERLHARLPQNSAQEREMNKELHRLLVDAATDANVTYQHPAPSGEPDDGEESSASED